MMNLLNKEKITRFNYIPRFEGSNICSWIGFKHVMYMAEEALLAHFRDCDLTPRSLYEKNGICFEIIDSEMKIVHAFHMDDSVLIEVVPSLESENNEMAFSINMFIDKKDELLKACKGKIRVQLRKSLDNQASVPLDDDLAKYVVQKISRSDSDLTVLTEGFDLSSEDSIQKILLNNKNAFVWKLRIPYFYCHFSERIQHSGYLRIMEEIVDLFLEDRGISIKNIVDSRKWIPVVPFAKVSILQEAYMEETMYTVFSVEDIFKESLYTAKMNCYVKRNHKLIKTASGKITHGYALIKNRIDWELVQFDHEVLSALMNRS